jgi:hypothetical protein
VKLATTPSGPAHADRVSSRNVALQDFALREVHPARSLLDGGGDEVLLEGGERDRAAGLQRENLGNLGAAAPHDLGGVEEQLGAFRRPRLRPGREGLGGGVDGNLRVRSAAVCDARIEGPIVWPVYVEQPLAFGGAPFATREVVVLLDAVDFGNALGLRHGFSPEISTRR